MANIQVLCKQRQKRLYSQSPNICRFLRKKYDVFVGTNTTILADIHIGSNVIIGADSLVNKDLMGGYVYAGVPARRICSFDE